MTLVPEQIMPPKHLYTKFQSSFFVFQLMISWLGGIF